MKKVIGEIAEKYKLGGIVALNEKECIEYVLGRKLKDTDTLKTLKEVIGQSTDPNVTILKEIFTLYLESKATERYSCRSSKEVFDFLYMAMRDLQKERFDAIFLNSQNRILSMETLFEGSLTSSSVYTREVIKQALQKNAAAMIFAHNHPSGVPSPSESDKQITENLVHACQLMEIKALDHIIIGDNRYFSFADSGLIKEYEISGKFGKNVAETALDVPYIPLSLTQEQKVNVFKEHIKNIKNKSNNNTKHDSHANEFLYSKSLSKGRGLEL
jgi:DNA repair protein RadC